MKQNKKKITVIDPHRVRKKNGERLYSVLYAGSNEIEVEQYYIEKFK